MSKISVGLDLSLTGTGWCLKEGDKYTYGLISTKPKGFENEYHRYQHIMDEILKVIPSNEGNEIHVAVEDYFVPHNSLLIRSSMVLVALGTVVRKRLYELGYKIILVVPTQLKKFATNSGKAKKGVIIKEVYRKWNIDCNDDNEADACVLATIAEVYGDSLNGENIDKWNEYERAVVKDLVSKGKSYNLS